MNKDEILKTTSSDGVLHVTINRPQALNALNTAFFDEMDKLIKAVKNDESIRVMVITGEGKAFVAGADIAEMVDKTTAQGTAFGMRGQRTFQSLESLPFPVIAAINGFALGGGLELAMACDFRIASEKAKFGQPEVNLGLIPGYSGTQRLPKLVGLGNALYMLISGEMIDASEALRMGLVQKVVPAEAFADEVMKLAKTVASKGPQAVRKVKRVTRAGMGMSFEQGCALEAEYFGYMFGPRSEGEEGMRAFLEKRKPNWQ